MSSQCSAILQRFKIALPNCVQLGISLGSVEDQLVTDPQLIPTDPQLILTDPQLIPTDPQLIPTDPKLILN